MDGQTEKQDKHASKFKYRKPLPAKSATRTPHVCHMNPGFDLSFLPSMYKSALCIPLCEVLIIGFGLLNLAPGLNLPFPAVFSCHSATFSLSKLQSVFLMILSSFVYGIMTTVCSSSES